MAREWTKFCLLVWKNYVLQKRHPVQTSVEVIIPIIFVIFLGILRSTIIPKYIDEPTVSSAFSPMDLSGTIIPFLGIRQFAKTAEILIKPRVFYSPKNPTVDIIMNEATSKLGLKAQGLNSESDILKKYDFMTDEEREVSLAGVVFENISSNDTELPPTIKVKFRFPAEMQAKHKNVSLDSWNTFLLFPTFQGTQPRNKYMEDGQFDPGYFAEGFLALQQSVSMSLLQYVDPKMNKQVIQMRRFPYPAYIDDPLQGPFQNMLAFIIALCFLYTCFCTVKAISMEKELQLKESMKIMGIPNSLHWCAWFLKTFIFLTISIVIMVPLMTIKWYPGASTSIFNKTHWSILLVFFLLYAVSIITYCFMMSTFFDKANTAAAVSGIIFLMTYTPYSFLQAMYEHWSTEAKLCSSLLLNTGMSLGLQIILMFEGTGDGLQWSTIWESPTADDNVCFGYILIMLAIDSILYMLIALYSEAVFPGNYGVSHPWYFPFQMSYWCGKKNKQQILKQFPRIRHRDLLTFEEEPNLRAGIRIKNLSKEFNNKLAVKDLSLNMYENQITVLLGHNGAGKTTTINSLIGMITPTNGIITVDDYDLNRNLEKVRDNLGFCPQHNILFKEMTVAEHIHFFAKLKGLNNTETEEEIKSFIRVLDLQDKRNALVCTLSGGMKRKLSAALALCGKSKIVIFDEPTAGMDPAARRTLWNLLLENKKGRTILLTTHFMDEADLLGDRIAIISNGELQCCGSSFFLKKRYGVGYRLIIVKGPACRTDLIDSLIQRYIPDIQVYQNIASELTYLLEENKSTLFEPILRELEQNLDFFEIVSFGISLTTMEEVFMKNYEINEKLEHPERFKESMSDIVMDEMNPQPSRFRNKTALNVPDTELLSGFPLYISQIKAMFLKHLWNTASTWAILLVQIITPVICLNLLFILIREMKVTRIGQPELNFTFEGYGETFTPVELLTKNTETEKYFNTYKNLTQSNIIDITTGRYSSYMVDYILKIATSKESFRKYREKHIVGATFDSAKSNDTSLITAWFNNQPFHSSPLSLNLVYNSILKDYNHSLNFSNHPLPLNLKSKITDQKSIWSIGFNLSLNFSMFLSFVSSFFTMFQLRERTSKSKHLQFVSGISSLTYWCISYIWDFFTLILVNLIIIATMAAFQEQGFSSPEQLGHFFTILVTHSLACLPLAYIFSYFSNTAATGFTKMFMFNVITGTILNFLTIIFKSLEMDDVSDILQWTFMSIFPVFNIASAVQELYRNEISNINCAPYKSLCFIKAVNVCCKDPAMCPDGKCAEMTDNYFDWAAPGIGRHILFHMIDAVIYTTLHVLIESGFFERFKHKERFTSDRWKSPYLRNTASGLIDQEDSDVIAEKEYIKSTDMEVLKESCQVIMIHLSKYYGNFVAVDRLCVGIKQGECFGLLGINGAGKTSTFKMLTGDENISFGEVYVNGFSLKTDMKKAQKVMGYCPQFDAVMQELTGRETLRMYCLIRGIPSSHITRIVESLAEELLFTKHIDKKVKDYSGGNKRKLSTAVALVGDPPVIYLDEPTAGMDPVAKRHLWNVICKLRDNGKCIILTSHSMEECEALCTRIAIMVNGQFKCLGSTQHLKTKFAEGYTFTVKAKTVTTEDLNIIKQFAFSSFPGAVLKEEREDMMVFFIPASNLSWSKIFGTIENAKESCGIIDYSIGQTSLEQVFLSFTKTQIQAAET